MAVVCALRFAAEHDAVVGVTVVAVGQHAVGVPVVLVVTAVQGELVGVDIALGSVLGEVEGGAGVTQSAAHHDPVVQPFVDTQQNAAGGGIEAEVLAGFIQRREDAVAADEGHPFIGTGGHRVARLLGVGGADHLAEAPQVGVVGGQQSETRAGVVRHAETGAEVVEVTGQRAGEQLRTAESRRRVAGMRLTGQLIQGVLEFFFGSGAFESVDDLTQRSNLKLCGDAPDSSKAGGGKSRTQMRLEYFSHGLLI